MLQDHKQGECHTGAKRDAGHAADGHEQGAYEKDRAFVRQRSPEEHGYIEQHEQGQLRSRVEPEPLMLAPLAVNPVKNAHRIPALSSLPASSLRAISDPASEKTTMASIIARNTQSGVSA